MTTTYATDDEIDDVWGATSVTSWADMDNDGNGATITARKDRARVVSKARIDDVLRDTHYTIPAANQAGTTPVTIVDLEARLAGIWLYENRGVIDFNPKTNAPYHRLAFARREARQQLEEIRAGRLKLDAV
jgi:hypothetical protein